jgi:4'-phosphopantetheinyl transferase
MRFLWEGPAGPAELALGEVHVWAACLDEPEEAALPSWLSGEEEARACRFRFRRDSRRFRVARAVLRGLLGGYLDLDPRELGIAYGPRGKPSVPGIHFNVSHSAELALFAFSRDRELGVDLEYERSLPEAGDIAGRYFSPGESAVLHRLPGPERAPAFFRGWTRKEAFIKATGDGLSRPLDSFDVSLAPDEPARLLRVEGDGEASRRWWLEDLRPAPGFAGALAVEGRPSALRCWRLRNFGEKTDGARRERTQDDLQGGRESRGTVFDLAS